MLFGAHSIMFYTTHMCCCLVLLQSRPILLTVGICVSDNGKLICDRKVQGYHFSVEVIKLPAAYRVVC